MGFMINPGAKTLRQQAAVDFMVSYGIAMLVIAIAVYVIIRLGVFGSGLAQPQCVGAPSFSCGDFAFASNGLLTIVLTQAVGGTMNMTGIACSTGVNVTGNQPQYGNIKVTSYTATPQYYPNNELANGLILYSDSSVAIMVNCYGPGGVSTMNLGTVYTGYIWINYTFSGLPPTYHTIERVAQFTARST
jgi:hypothetical protein